MNSDFLNIEREESQLDLPALGTPRLPFTEAFGQFLAAELPSNRRSGLREKFYWAGVSVGLFISIAEITCAIAKRIDDLENRQRIRAEFDARRMAKEARTLDGDFISEKFETRKVSYDPK